MARRPASKSKARRTKSAPRRGVPARAAAHESESEASDSSDEASASEASEHSDTDDEAPPFAQPKRADAGSKRKASAEHRIIAAARDSTAIDQSSYKKQRLSKREAGERRAQEIYKLFRACNGGQQRRALQLCMGHQGITVRSKFE